MKIRDLLSFLVSKGNKNSGDCMFYHTKKLQYFKPPEKPDAVYAMKIQGKDSGNRVLTKGTVEVEYHKYEPKPASRTRERKFGPVIQRRTGKHDH
jgi:hypothetical protein